MTDFIRGENRQQSTLFPEALDDYISEDNAVRVIDVFVDELDLSGLGFRTEPSVTGRPAYHPATLLKIFIYGYMNRVQSSRRLEREASRNVELMWLTGRLAPDFKTIADFRKDNGEAIRQVCREFVFLCRRLELFTEAFVAIDGSKFKAVNNWDRNFTRAKLKRRLRQIDESIERYLSQMASADRQETAAAKGKSQRLKDKIEVLKGEIGRLKKVEVRLQEAPDQQISETDPDARSMATSGRGSGIVGYNVQAAVDTKHHLMVAHEVTNERSDRAQLVPMAEQARDAINTDELTVVADRGYFSGTQIVECEQAGITTYVAKPLTSAGRKAGRFTKQDFVYEPEHDRYRCPAGKHLTRRFDTFEKGLRLHVYFASVPTCRACPQQAQCTEGKHVRRIRRWEREGVLDSMQERLDQEPERMRLRRETAEHPFATLKSWMGATHFQMKTLKRVSTEMSLHVLAYNMKRVINILGPIGLIEAMRV